MILTNRAGSWKQYHCWRTQGKELKEKRDKCRLGDSKYGLNIFYINMKNRVALMNKVESKLEALKKLSSQLVTITQTKTSRTTHWHTQERKHNQASHFPLFSSLMRRIRNNTEVWSIKPTRPSLKVQSYLSPCPHGKPRFQAYRGGGYLIYPLPLSLNKRQRGKSDPCYKVL